MACHWLTKYTPPNVKQVEFLFPFLGHSFLPYDHVFRVLEKTLRKKERIYNQQEYIDVLIAKEHSELPGMIYMGGIWF